MAAEAVNWLKADTATDNEVTKNRATRAKNN